MLYNFCISLQCVYSPPPPWRCGPTQAMASSFTRFLDHTQRRTTVGRTSLDEWSDRLRDLYLPTHNTQHRQAYMPLAGFEPTVPASERLWTHACTVRPLWPATVCSQIYIFFLCNIESRPWNQCCSGKTINVAYSESVFVALGMQHAMSMRHIVMCGLLACTLFFHIFSQTEISDTSYWTQNFGHKLLNTEFRTQVTEHIISDTSYWKQNFGHNLLTTKFRAQVTEHRISGKSY